MTRPAVPAIALLPLRGFLGLTFLWAGLDKLLDPTFFDPTAPTSISAQLVAFARQSPLGAVIHAALPFAAPIGLLIAVAEIGVGIGALTGLAFRLAALGGAALSALFWLTASWPTHPFYVGADLPFLFGWLTLAAAGHGHVLVSHRSGADAASRISTATPVSAGRRVVIEAGLLAGLAAIVASITAPLRAVGIASEPTAQPTPTPVTGPGASPAATGWPAPAPSSRLAVARVADVERAGSATFTIPFGAPAPLPAGDPGIVVKLPNGSFVGYDAVCTHAGCTVEYDSTAAIIFCPCHGAEYDPAHDAAVIDGPTRQPLTKLPLSVDATTGTISLSIS